jgi:hypothetical protein
VTTPRRSLSATVQTLTEALVDAVLLAVRDAVGNVAASVPARSRRAGAVLPRPKGASARGADRPTRRLGPASKRQLVIRRRRAVPA